MEKRAAQSEKQAAEKRPKTEGYTAEEPREKEFLCPLAYAVV